MYVCMYTQRLKASNITLREGKENRKASLVIQPVLSWTAGGYPSAESLRGSLLYIKKKKTLEPTTPVPYAILKERKKKEQNIIISESSINLEPTAS